MSSPSGRAAPGPDGTGRTDSLAPRTARGTTPGSASEREPAGPGDLLADGERELQEAERLELLRALERAGVHRSEAGRLDDADERRLRVGVVAGDEHRGGRTAAEGRDGCCGVLRAAGQDLDGRAALECDGGDRGRHRAGAEDAERGHVFLRDYLLVQLVCTQMVDPSTNRLHWPV